MFEQVQVTVYGQGVNRTDRLYAVIEELRASAPRRRTARELADRFAVSERTIERDISTLQQAGIPVYAGGGPREGYALDQAMTLPPLNLTPAEAVAVAVTLDQADAEGSPYAPSARTALRKIVAAMSAADGAAAREFAQRIRFLVPVTDETTATVPAIVAEAVAERRVVRLSYVDRGGAVTERDVEPVAFVSGGRDQYLIGWCRLRQEARAFRVDRINRATLRDEPVPPRRYDEEPGPAITDLVAHALDLEVG
jgi:predicted DNA-binding transcriptional regulator YafY